METRKMKLALSAGALALSMALAGCGGGSSSGPTTPTTTPAVAQLDAITKAHEAALALVGQVTSDNPTEAQIEALEDANADLSKAIEEGTAVSEDDKSNYQTQLSGLELIATLAEGVRAGTVERGMLRDQINQLARCGAGTTRESGVCVPTKRDRAGQAAAKALLSVLGTGFGSTVDGFNPTKLIGSDTEDVTLKEDKDTSVGPLNGWEGKHYKGDQGTDGKLSAESRIYSNKEEPKKVALTITGATTEDGVYTVRSDSIARTDDSNIKGDQFPAAGDAAKTYNDDGSSRSFAGTYNGAQGTYSCIGATCTATANASGAISLTAGTWTFTPASGDAGKADDPDDSYAQFGWWVFKNDGKPTNSDTFADITGTVVLPAALNAAGLNGQSATYKGSAAGKFAVYHPSEDINESGHFTADAELTAAFKTAGSTMSGTINNFKLNDSDTNPGWSVALMSSAVVNGEGEFIHPNSDNDPGTVWSVDGDAVEDSKGTWSAQLFHDDNTGSPTIPDTVVGSFESEFANTHKLIGAFGATKQ